MAKRKNKPQVMVAFPTWNSEATSEIGCRLMFEASCKLVFGSGFLLSRKPEMTNEAKNSAKMGHEKTTKSSIELATMFVADDDSTRMN